MIIDFIIEDLMLNSYLQKNFHTLTNSLYNEKNLIGRLHQYFSIYFKTFSSPAAETLFLLALSILAMESADSIRSLYRHFCLASPKSH